MKTINNPVIICTEGANAVSTLQVDTWKTINNPIDRGCTKPLFKAFRDVNESSIATF